MAQPAPGTLRLAGYGVATSEVLKATDATYNDVHFTRNRQSKCNFQGRSECTAVSRVGCSWGAARRRWTAACGRFTVSVLQLSAREPHK